VTACHDALVERTGVTVAVVGTLNLDHTARVARLPRAGEGVVGEMVAIGPGGKGANQAVAAARLGAATALIGCVGDDAAGTAVLDALAAEAALDLGGVVRVAAPTGTAFVTIDDAGTNTVVSTRGANGWLDEEHVHRHGRAIAEAAVVLVQRGVPDDAVRAAVDIARSVDTLVILDPAPPDGLPDDVLRRVDVCTPNETELESLTGIAPESTTAMARASDALLARGCGAVVLTLGARGAFLATGRAPGGVVEPYAMAVVDPTGAGDACCGALAVALARQCSIDEAVTEAMAAGALATTRVGTIAAMPTRAEVEAVLARG
jgi:ribokinase